MRKVVIGGVSRVSDWLDEGCDVSVFWDEGVGYFLV